jgi:hypothetical protein
MGLKSKKTKYKKSNNSGKNGRIVLANHVQLSFLKLYRNSISDIAGLVMDRPSAFVILLYLYEHCERGSNKVVKSFEDIANGLATINQGKGVSWSSVKANMRYLRDKKLLTYKFSTMLPVINLNSRYFSKGNEIEGKGFYDHDVIDPAAVKQFYDSGNRQYVKERELTQEEIERDKEDFLANRRYRQSIKKVLDNDDEDL